MPLPEIFTLEQEERIRQIVQEEKCKKQAPLKLISLEESNAAAESRDTDRWSVLTNIACPDCGKPLRRSWLGTGIGITTFAAWCSEDCGWKGSVKL